MLLIGKSREQTQEGMLNKLLVNRAQVNKEIIRIGKIKIGLNAIGQIKIKTNKIALAVIKTGQRVVKIEIAQALVLTGHGKEPLLI